MTVKVTIQNSGERGHVCRLRYHRRNIGGDVLLDVQPQTILQSGRSVDVHLVTATQGTRDMVVIEEGDSEMHFLSTQYDQPVSEREQKLEDALVEIKHWAGAYPVGVFSEPDFERARLALDTVGISMDSLHGTWARHLLKGVGEIATNALT